MKVETFTPANVMKPIGPYSHIAKAFGNHLPARTVVVVADLPKKNALMTMNLTAVTKD